ncbi:MAG: hypothetical protein ACLP8S_27745 [Solirubrobacteraceae bacterium]
MESTDIVRVPGAPSAGSSARVDIVPAADSGGHQQCEACGAAVAHDQRYCVACGARRQHVRDPAARFLSRASANARSERALPQARTATRRRSPTLAGALLLAVIPLALAVGVLVGRASTSGDAKLVAELRAQKPELITTAGTTAASSTTAAAATAATTTSNVQATKPVKKSGHASKKRAAKTQSSTQPGATQQLSTSKPTQQQLSQGAAVVRKVQQASGKSYVNSQQGLPNVVAVP